MSIGQSLVDTPLEDVAASVGVADVPPEQEAALTAAEEAEAMEAAAYWSAVTTLKPVLWQCDVVIRAVRYDALLISKEEPDHRKVAAAIATAYKLDVHTLINEIVNMGAPVLVHPAVIYDDDDIKDNYIPF